MENQSKTGFNDKKILIVEDELPMSKALQIKLEQTGAQILHASNGQEGLDVALRELPDLVILDIMMPVMDGMAMLRLLRADDNGKKMHVIILTNVSDNDKIGEGMNLSADNYLTKSDTKLDTILDLVQQKLTNGE